MIQTREKFLSEEDERAVRLWLGHPSAAIFRKIVLSEAAKAEIESASRHFEEAFKGPAQDTVALRMNIEIWAKNENCLTVMDEIIAKPRLSTVELTTNQP